MPGLLFDQNLAPRLVRLLADRFAGSAHVRERGLASAPDVDVWSAAAALGLMIASKDADFVALAAVRGPPPRVVWVRLGNCSTNEIAELLRRNADAIDEFAASPAVILALG